MDNLDSARTCNRARGLQVVAGDHDAFDASLSQSSHRLSGVGFQLVRHRESSLDDTLNAHVNHCLSTLFVFCHKL